MVALLFYAIMSYLGSIKLSKYLSSTVYIIRYLLLSRRAGRKNISKVKSQMTQVSFEVNLRRFYFQFCILVRKATLFYSTQNHYKSMNMRHSIVGHNM